MKYRLPLSENERQLKKRYEELLAKTENASAIIGDGADKSSTSGDAKRRTDWRREADKVDLPDLPTVPGYAVWLESVMRLVMDGSASPLDGGAGVVGRNKPHDY